MPGTLITYQGHPCRSATFQRARGIGSQTSEVVMPIKGWPAGFTWRHHLLREEIEPGDLTPINREEARSTPQPLPLELRSEGTLVMAEINSDGLVGQLVEVPGLIIVGIDTVSSSSGSDVAMVRVTLADDRLFWALGVMPRWSFNRVRADGTVALDSVNPDGSPVTRADVARLAARHLHRSPEVTHLPEHWTNPGVELELPPWPPALLALSMIVLEASAEEPCLRLDRSLAIHQPGEGKIGYAPGGAGPNAEEIPKAVIKDSQGRGQAFSLQAGFPEEFMVVSTLQPTVATVALDDWEPVLVIEGEVLYLSEELVRELTVGRFGLDWLRRFVMLPQADQMQVNLPQDVARILREQAYQLYRLPGMELIEEGRYTGEAGPNAHMTPLLRRAETAAGRRLPVVVETYRWTTMRKTLAQSAADNKVEQALKAMLKLRQEFGRLARSRGLRDPMRNPVGEGLGVIGTVGRVTVEQFLADAQGVIGLDRTLLDRNKLQVYLNELRRLNRVDDQLGGGNAALYEQAYIERLRALDAENGGTREILFELAKKLNEFEKQADELRSPLNQGNVELEALGPAIEAAVKEAIRAIKAKQQEDQIRAETGQAFPGGELTVAVALKNLSRGVDAGAKVYDADQCVVMTSPRTGHAFKTDVPTPALTSLVPRPVRVTFGATLRPRLDQPPPAQTSLTPDDLALTRSAEGATPADAFGGQNNIPSILTDVAGYYVSAWKREEGAAVQVPVSEVPLDKAKAVKIPGLLLEPLNPADSNRQQLDQQALERAAQAFARPELTSGSTHELSGPWPIQCDGIVQAVRIVTEFEADTPCGFTTYVTIGETPAKGSLMRSVTRATQQARLFADPWQREALTREPVA